LRAETTCSAIVICLLILICVVAFVALSVFLSVSSTGLLSANLGLHLPLDDGSAIFHIICCAIYKSFLSFPVATEAACMFCCLLPSVTAIALVRSTPSVAFSELPPVSPTA
jgi:cellulose synthase/poly-beta-1,6-N-acetylglucosamine synthase-like glycosyltransferase